MGEGYLDQVTIDADQSEKLVKLLDTVVIKLEGGSEVDLQVLENPPVQPAAEKVYQWNSRKFFANGFFNYLCFTCTQPKRNQEKVASEGDNKETEEMQEGENVKDDGALEDLKTDTIDDPKNAVNNKGIFVYIVQFRPICN